MAYLPPSAPLSSYRPVLRVQKTKVISMPPVETRKVGRRPNLSTIMAMEIETMRASVVWPAERPSLAVESVTPAES